jgi:hypothetical protein
MIATSQILLTFLGALFGAVLGGAVRWSGMHRERQLKLTIDLYSEFHAPPFMRIREHAHDVIEAAPSIAAAYENSAGEARESVASIVHFWERVALLMRAGAVDESLLRRFFGQYARWWNEILCERSPSCLDDPEWGQSLREISWLFARLSKSRRLGSRR